MEDKIQEIKKRYQQIEAELNNPANFNDYAKIQNLNQEKTKLAKILNDFDKYERAKLEIAENQELINQNQNDQEMIALAEDEIKKLHHEQKRLQDLLNLALLPSDPDDDKDVILEIRAGTGGDEAELFAGELLRMYLRYCENKHFQTQILSANKSGLGGIKEVVMEISQNQPYKYLKYESGIHRVQRIPKTEKSGRLHTSACSVVVLPKASEVDVEVNNADLKIDTYHASGHGGQSVNTTDSAIRITHLPTGLVVTCQDERSQLKNRLKAMSILRSRLLAQKIESESSSTSAKRKIMVGSGDRSEKIRTYNFPQDRVSDHRINFSQHNLINFMNGDLDNLIEHLIATDQKEKLAKE